MSIRTSFERHSGFIAAVLTVVAALLGLVAAFATQEATNAGSRVETLEPQLREQQARSEELEAALGESQDETRALQSEVEDLRQQLGSRRPSAAPATGSVLYTDKVLQVPLSGHRSDAEVDLRAGRVLLGDRGLAEAAEILSTFEGARASVRSVDRNTALSTSVGMVETSASCQEAVSAAPVTEVRLEPGTGMCVLGGTLAAHIVVADLTEEAVTYRVTAWERSA